MKNRFLSLVLALVALVGLSAPTFAQTTVTQTTLSAALAVDATKLTLASGTGVSAGVLIYVDREALRVVSTSSPYSTTSPRVARAVAGTLQAAHPSAAIVVVGILASVTNPTGGPLVMADPPLGSCVAANETYSFRVNVTNGKHWKCVNSLWSQISPNGGPDVKTFPIGGGAVGAVIASAATIAPTSYIHHVSGVVAVVNITVPAGCATTCTIILIPDAIFTWTAAGNIYLAGTAVVNKALYMTYDGTKWVPSYIA